MMHPVLRYAELGWLVLPAWPLTKRACLPWAMASCDPALIRAWLHGDLIGSDRPAARRGWRRCFARANWMVVLGPGSGLVVLDVESHSGMGELKKLFREHGDQLPETPTVISGGWTMGRHLYFAYPEGQKLRGQRWLVPKTVEARANRVLITVPPSHHAESGKAYEWDGHRTPWVLQPAQMPSWLVDLLTPAPSPEYKPLPKEKIGNRYVQAAIESEASEMAAIPPGDRNHQLNARTFKLMRRFADNGLADEQTIRETMFAAGIAAGLGEVEARATVLSAIRAARARS